MLTVLMQLYVYEYTEESEIAEFPRQICPYAMVAYYYIPVSEDGRMRSSLRYLSAFQFCYMCNILLLNMMNVVIFS